MYAITSDKHRVGPWVAKKVMGAFHPNVSEAIGLDRSGDLVAGVIYEGWNHASIVVHIAIEGRMTPTYLGAIFHYPFSHVGANKIIAPIGELNEESIGFVENLGFRLEGRIPDAHPDGALLLYTMSRSECRFLGERYGQKFRVSAACS